MGTASRLERHTPSRLAEKLRHIRLALGLSQNQMLRQLGSPEMLQQSSISGYERGVREPPLLVLLEYARAANVYVDVLLDDELDLPRSSQAHAGMRASGARGRPAGGADFEGLRPWEMPGPVPIYFFYCTPAEKTSQHREYKVLVIAINFSPAEVTAGMSDSLNISWPRRLK